MSDIYNREQVESHINLETDPGDLLDQKSNLDVLERFIADDGNEEGSTLGGEEDKYPPLGSFSADSKSPEDGSKAKSALTLDSRKPSSRSSTTTSQTTTSEEQASSISRTMLKRKKKSKGVPTRPLSAYNLFFQSERTKIQASAKEAGEKIGFEGLGKIIGKKWQELENAARKIHEKMAEKDSMRYRKEMDAYNELKKKRTEEEEITATSTPLIETARKYNLQGPSSAAAQGQSPFLVAGVPPALQISPGEEFSQLPSSMTTPVASSPFVPWDRQLGRPPLDGSSSVLYYQSQQYGGSTQRIAAHEMPVPPPAPPGAERVPTSDSLHMSPGMEIVLRDQLGQDRRYRVEYTWYSMSRDAAREYIESVPASPTNERKRHPQPSYQPQQTEMHSGVISQQGPQQATAGGFWNFPQVGGLNSW
jgi:hypothetical protein